MPYDALPILTDGERTEQARSFREAISSRRSCRMFSDAPVPRDVIEEAILAAGTAPSGANHQPWHFAVVSSPEIKHRIRIEAELEEAAFYAGKAGQEWLEERWHRLRLAAHGTAQGGTGDADPHALADGILRDICGRPANEKPVMVIVAGLPADQATVPEHALRKKPLGQISSWL